MVFLTQEKNIEREVWKQIKEEENKLKKKTNTNQRRYR